MLNLAPVKYANCFESEGGPLHSIEESKIDINGERMTVANARLSEKHRPGRRRKMIFAPIDGTGLDRVTLVARHKAISEAVERWAHFGVSESRDGKRFGFAEDPTSNGMSAYPGLFPRQARSNALREAVERFALIAWWAGKTSIRQVEYDHSGIRVYEIAQPFSSFQVLVTRRENKKGFTAFGYGCAKNFAKAKEGAVVEMERSRILLESFYQRNPGFEIGDLTTLPDYLERRLLYFSMPEGVAEFEEKLENDMPPRVIEKPKITFDGEIKGPWSKYATVWRVALEMPTRDFLDPNQKFFYW